MKNLKVNFSILEKSVPKQNLPIGKIFIILFILYVICTNFQQVLMPLFWELRYIAVEIIKNPKISYEEKMKVKVGYEYYDWAKLVRDHTGTNSNVLHPPQMWPWPQSGNPEFSQYFLYPAKLIREDRERMVIKRDISDVLIAWGEGGAEDSRLLGWPKFPVFDQKIYYLPQNREVEVKGIGDLREWSRNADRTIKFYNGQKWKIEYTSSQYDYWLKPMNEILTSNNIFQIDVKSNWMNSTSLIVRVDFGDGKDAIFSSGPNDKVGEWVRLELPDLYLKAFRFAQLRNWPINNLRISGIGIDTGHPAIMPYREKWGFIEVETGSEERKTSLEKGLVNVQNLLRLGNIYFLNNDYVKALGMYREAASLEPTNPWPHLETAEIAKKLNNKELAELEFEAAIRGDSDDAWFYYALGKFYSDNNDFDKAIDFYQKALDYYPDSSFVFLGLGEVYDKQNRLDLATKYYRLASLGPRKEFVSDGKLAWIRLKEIEGEYKAKLKDSLGVIATNPDNWQERIKLAQIYTILGDVGTAKEHYKAAYLLNSEAAFADIEFPPSWIDKLSHPFYGKKGIAVDMGFTDNKLVSLLDNYHSFITFDGDLFLADKGTIEIKWKPVASSDGLGKFHPMNLAYQYDGFAIWFVEDKFFFSIYNQKDKNWQTISSPSIQLDPNKWYWVGVSYGDKGQNIILDDNVIAQSNFDGGISIDKKVYLGKGFVWERKDKTSLSGYFDTIQVYDYQKQGKLK